MLAGSLDSGGLVCGIHSGEVQATVACAEVQIFPRAAA